jgi:hypothetical protein
MSLTTRPSTDDDRRSSAPLFGGLLLLLLAFFAMQARSAPPDPRPADAPASEFSAGRAAQVLKDLVGDGTPHVIGTEANARVRDRVVAAFRANGYAPEIQTAFVCGRGASCGTVHNVVVRRPGRQPGRAVLLATHYDSVAAGPGASDDGVSVAATLEIARALAAEPPHRNEIILLVDDGEEAGLLGAEAFARDHPAARDVGAVVNLEARGTEGASVMFETSRENAWLVRLLARSLDRPMASSLFYPVYERLPNDTDLTVFKRHGMAGVNFAFIGGVARYHTPIDDVAHASPASLQHQGQNALAMIRALADGDLSNPPAGQSVFFDVLGLGIVRWPRGLTLPLAVGALLLVLAAAFVLRQRAAAPLWRSVVGLVSWLVAVAIAGAGAWILWRWLVRAGAWPGEATTQPSVAVMAFWLVGLGLAWLTASVTGRWGRPAGAWTGCWLGWSIAACAAAFYVAEASYLLIVPALVAGAVGVVAASRGTTPGFVATMLPLGVAALLWMSPAWFLFGALGSIALPAIGAAVAVMGSGLAPLLAGAGRGRWSVPLITLAVGAALAAVSLRAPAFSSEQPERMNVAYFQLADEAQAQWVVTPQSGVLPEPMRQAVAFGDGLRAPFPWSTRATSFVAPAGSGVVAAPALEIVAREPQGAQRLVRLHVTSPRGARVVMLVIPPERVVSARIGGREIPPREPAGGSRGQARGALPPLRSYTCVTVPPEGISFEVTLSGDEPVEGYVVDQTSGLPAGGEVLVPARPREATAIHSGDVTTIARRVSL